jgi:hypothetical protein
LHSTEILFNSQRFLKQDQNQTPLEYPMSTAEALQIPLDHDLAKSLQANSQAQNLGLAEFVRRAVLFYVRLNEEMEIRRQYQKGYGDADLTALALEMKDWEEEQAWPEA